MWALSSHLCWYRWHISYRTLHIFVIQIVLFGQVKKAKKIIKANKGNVCVGFSRQIRFDIFACRSMSFAGIRKKSSNGAPPSDMWTAWKCIFNWHLIETHAEGQKKPTKKARNIFTTLLWKNATRITHEKPIHLMNILMWMQ